MSFTEGGNSGGPQIEGSDAEQDYLDGLSDFGKNFLQTEIQDENLRRQMAPHVKAWDKGANQHFQRIHAEYAPYRDLGDLNTLQQHVNFTRRFNADPEGTLALLLEHEVVTPAQLQKLLGSRTPEQAADGDSDDLEAKLLRKVEEKLGAVESKFTGLQQQQELERGRQELEKAIDHLRKQHGDDFHEDLVLAAAAQMRIPLDQAHDFVTQQIQKAIAKRTPPRAPGHTMPGSGAGASFNKKPEDLQTSEDRKAYIVSRLLAAKNQ